MKRVLIWLLTLLLALPFAAVGEGTDVPVEAFIEKTGIEADAATRARIEDFLRSQFITAPMLEMIDVDRLGRYAEYLKADIPISYAALTEAPSQSRDPGAALTQLALTVPQGAATESLLVDFERARVYYDETWPVPMDVCRAQYAGPLSEADAAKLKALIDAIPAEAPGAGTGVELSAVSLCIAWDGGVTRLTAAGSDASEAFMNSVWALLDAGRAAAQGENL